MNYAASRFASVIAAAALTVAAGCSAHSGTALPPMASNAAPEPMPRAASSAVSVLNKLRKQIVIGSTVDPKFGQLNPYGLTVAPSTNGAFAAGDLAVCNFNAKRNVQGTGFTIVALHPKAGSTPRLVAAGRELTGCNSLALAPDDTIWAAAFSADDNPVIAANGKLLTNVKGTAFDRPWGQAFAVPKHGAPAFYESNTGDGTILRIGLGARFTYTTIARGFAVNHGQPGSIFGPSGLSYDAANDTLYVVDGQTNTVVALTHVTSIPADGILVSRDGKSFSGSSGRFARLVYAGAPLNGPISAALLYNGNLVVGNTSDPNGKNLLVELSASGKLLDVRNVDKGPAGALFGIVATGTSTSDTAVYFNDDNDNNLQALVP